MNVSRRSVGNGYGNDSNVYTDGDGSDSNDDLRWVLYLTMIYGAIEVIVIYGKYDFLNVAFLSIVVDCTHMFAFNLPVESLWPGVHSADVGVVEYQWDFGHFMVVYVCESDMESADCG